ncbi:hypothetical protein [uncultured Rikenella sp.]|uniref:hypothetical protein n=1 Tax=uncultured Rikenella sp. TaxID=368003 RepID=UPI00262E1008|nr:hypothetical protein [uncultured Rikenella sp.]
MGLFGRPKCPHCGAKLEPTNYSFPYPQWRCRSCIERNAEEEKRKKRIAELEKRIAELEQTKQTE